MEDINSIIGKNLSSLRKEAKLTQMELAEKFNYSDKSISKWEAGDCMPSIEVLYDLAKFYNVNLDYLVSLEHPEKQELADSSIKKKSKDKKVKEKKPKMFPTKIVITLLAICAVWVIATTVFVCLKLVAKVNYPLCFLWALPASFIVCVVFNSIWGHYRYLFPILSALLWTLIVCIHVQVLAYSNIWPIYFLGIPLQVAIILWGALVKKPKGYVKKQKEEKAKLKELEKQQIESDINSTND